MYDVHETIIRLNNDAALYDLVVKLYTKTPSILASLGQRLEKYKSLRRIEGPARGNCVISAEVAAKPDDFCTSHGISFTRPHVNPNLIN